MIGGRTSRPWVLRALAECRAGAALIEFALLAPVAMAMLFSLIEGGRMYWTKQTLNEVAYATARCMSVGTACNDETKQKNYAVSRAAGYAIRINTGDVDVYPGTTCRGIAGSNRVSVTHQFASAVRGLLPFLPAEISATACFPVLA